MKARDVRLVVGSIRLLCCALTFTCCFPMRGAPGVFEVTSGRDASDRSPGDGACKSTLPRGACTLRAAIEESNALAGPNTIQLGRRAHKLTLVPYLHVTDAVRLQGAGAGSSVIDGMRRGDRVFHFDGSVAWLTDLTILNGYGQFGGAIWVSNGGVVSLTNAVVTNNEAFTGGGGIYVEDGHLVLVDSSVSNNRATGAFAGGIWVNEKGRLTIDRSTIDSNESNRCGGIYNFGRLRISNSTISGNVAGSDRRGTGGLINIGSARLNNVTIYGNSSNAEDPESSGGLTSFGTAETAAGNTILAANRRGRAANDCTGRIDSLGHNFVQATNGCVLSGVSEGNLAGSDPNLLPLAFNFGAPTRSHLPAPGSPVLSAGHPQVGPMASIGSPCEPRDQSGRGRQLSGRGRRCDMGSIEGS